MRSIKLTLAYDGSDFAGWQAQPAHRTVQVVLEGAIQAVTGEALRIEGSGRTDAGVHALAQVASFATASRLAADVLGRAINAHLPEDVVVLSAEEEAAGFHARRDARGKCYRYAIEDGPPANLFSRRYAWQLRERLDAEAMDRAARHLAGKHDFASFQTSGSERASTVRTVRRIEIARRGGPIRDRLEIEIEADGFLYNMVRNIVGTLVRVGQGDRPESSIGEVLASRDRRAAGMTAPAHGLFLVSVDYNECGAPGAAAENEIEDSQ
jgi:tRNA pseudouridine38-40 synthase